MIVAKEIIRPGEYWYTDRDGKPQKLVASPEFIRHLRSQGRAMLAAGLSIPVPLEHQPAAVPVTNAEAAARRLRDNAGWIRGYTILPGDRLFGLLDIQDVEIANKLPKTIKWTSPHITSFVDGSGRAWDGVISHLALTTRPRITKQEPFPSIAAALSMFPSLQAPDLSKSFKGLDANVSRAGLVEKIGDVYLPHFSAAFSALAGIKLADDEPEKKKEGDDEPPAKKDGDGDGEVGDASPDNPALNGEGGDQGKVIDDEGNLSVYELLGDLLPAIGIDVGECNSDNFLECLYKAVVAKMKENVQQDDMQDITPNNNGDDSNNTPNPIVQESQPMYMSTEQINAIQDPIVRATASRAQRIEKRALAEYATKRAARLDKLAKSLQSAKAREMVLSLQKDVRLSLGEDGEVIDPTEPTIALAEETAASIPDLRTQYTAPGGASFGRAREEAHPEWGGETMSPERASAVIDEFCGNVGLRNPQAGAGDSKVTELVSKLLDIK